MTIEESLARVQIESPHHGPIVAAEVTRLEARLASAERVVELGIGLASWAASAKPRPADNTNEWMSGLIVRTHNFAVASDAHSAAKDKL